MYYLCRNSGFGYVCARYDSFREAEAQFRRDNRNTTEVVVYLNWMLSSRYCPEYITKYALEQRLYSIIGRVKRLE